jgi:hypothetical protein
MADNTMLARAFVRAAKIRATELGGANTPKKILETILLGQFTSTATNGRTLIRTNEAGGSVEFAVAADLGPADVMSICEDALRIVENSPDPNNPTVQTRRIMRLRASFRQASF